MDAAGYSDGVTAIMLSYAEENQTIVTEPLNSQLREVGIDLQFITGSFAEIVPRIIPDFQIEGGGSGPWTTATQGHMEGFEIIPFFGLPRGSGSKQVRLAQQRLIGGGAGPIESVIPAQAGIHAGPSWRAPPRLVGSPDRQGSVTR